MKVTLLQTDIQWCEAERNRAAAERLMEEAGETDLFVLPEMFSTGFCLTPDAVAEVAGKSDGPTLAWMKRQAALRRCAVAGSVAVSEEGKFYNRFYFVQPDGVVTHYDKRHTFTYGGESANYTVGNRRVIVRYKDFRILLMVCYDLRFPVWGRNRGDYDAVIYVANWPASRVRVWDTLLRARALENQCFVVGVNRVGSDPTCPYSGHSAVIDAYGKERLLLDDSEQHASCTIELEPLLAFREKFAVLNDADDFSLDYSH